MYRQKRKEIYTSRSRLSSPKARLCLPTRLNRKLWRRRLMQDWQTKDAGLLDNVDSNIAPNESVGNATMEVEWNPLLSISWKSWVSYLGLKHRRVARIIAALEFRQVHLLKMGWSGFVRTYQSYSLKRTKAQLFAYTSRMNTAVWMWRHTIAERKAGVQLDNFAREYYTNRLLALVVDRWLSQAKAKTKVENGLAGDESRCGTHNASTVDKESQALGHRRWVLTTKVFTKLKRNWQVARSSSHYHHALKVRVVRRWMLWLKVWYARWNGMEKAAALERRQTLSRSLCGWKCFLKLAIDEWEEELKVDRFIATKYIKMWRKVVVYRFYLSEIWDVACDSWSKRVKRWTMHHFRAYLEFVYKKREAADHHALLLKTKTVVEWRRRVAELRRKAEHFLVADKHCHKRIRCLCLSAWVSYVAWRTRKAELLDKACTYRVDFVRRKCLREMRMWSSKRAKLREGFDVTSKMYTLRIVSTVVHVWRDRVLEWVHMKERMNASMKLRANTLHNLVMCRWKRYLFVVRALALHKNRVLSTTFGCWREAAFESLQEKSDLKELRQKVAILEERLRKEEALRKEAEILVRRKDRGHKTTQQSLQKLVDRSNDQLEQLQTRLKCIVDVSETDEGRLPMMSWEISYKQLTCEEKIGSGSYGHVFRGRWLLTDIAVKKLVYQKLDEELLKDFRAEVHVLKALRHPNIILFLGACTQPPNLCIVSEYMSRRSLYDVLHRTGEKLSYPLKLRMALDAARGMNYLHGVRPPILHRDFKTMNLLVDEHYRVKIADFGFARVKNYRASDSGQCGTIEYMSPEAIMGEQVNEKADVYGFAITLWELMAEAVPYKGMKPMQAAMAVANRNLRPMVNDQWDPEIRQLMQSCWETQPDERPSFRSIVTTLESILQHQQPK